MNKIRLERIAIRGRVQGVGMRPYLYRQACRLNLSGQVRNTTDGVELLLQGRMRDIDAFLTDLHAGPPPQAQIRSVQRSAACGRPFDGFCILPSTTGTVTTAVPPDRATCPECVQELFDPDNRRYHHPFISCTQCGPRHSIVQSLPWDRCRTSMDRFSLCQRCATEVRDAADRRFHSQTNCCHDCGPQLKLFSNATDAERQGAAALASASTLLNGGGLLAVKGPGGYQLLARADCGKAISRLRQIKMRQRKPLALLFKNLDDIAECCRINTLQAEQLSSPLTPIVLVPRRATSAPIDQGVAPGLDRLGVMLPASPLQHLLLAPLDGPVVATSANRRGEPLCYQDQAAIALFVDRVDGILTHDRAIIHPLDDSIMQAVLERSMVLRRSRGFDLSCGCVDQAGTTTLAFGADLKNCIAVNRGTEILSAPHVGNLDSLAAESLLKARASTLCELYRLQPQRVVCDPHPDYVSRRLAQDSGLALQAVQHHRAHAWATLLENPMARRPLLAVIWDGTGYGEDGTVWGGEFFRMDDDGDEQRLASLHPMRLPGGEQAIREPARVAFSLLYSLFGDAALTHPALPAAARIDYPTLAQMLSRGINAPLCSSAGRLFDGVAALLGLHPLVDYEAEAAIALEQLACRYRQPHKLSPYPLTLLNQQQQPWRLDWRPMLLALLADIQNPASPAEQIAARFHLSMAHAILRVTETARCADLLVGGGCFQNQLLMEMLHHLAGAHDITLHWPRNLPPGDGGIAAGQLFALLSQQGDH